LARAALKKASALNLLAPELREKLRAEPFPEWIEPMKATLTEDYFSDPQWLFERKLDGVRIIAYKHGVDVHLWTRNRRLNDHTYPEVREAIMAQTVEDVILDGEVTAFRGKQSSFSLLQDRLGLATIEEALASGIEIEYYVFDILHMDGYSTLRLPQIERKELLRQAIEFNDVVHYNEHRMEKGEKFLVQACKAGWEGLIAKDASAVYQPGKRNDGWLKFKCSHEQEFVIAGYTEPQGERDYFGALLLGYYDGGKLRYAGKVGTGFDNRELKDLHQRMAPQETEVSPFDAADRVREKWSHWLKPKLVCQVAFTEWTDDGKLRHPRYVGLREDKPARDVVREVPVNG
jgi:bifunctional non-homologous end joining protein LigD